MGINNALIGSVSLEVVQFLKANNFSVNSIKFAAAYYCARAPEMFGQGLEGRDYETLVEREFNKLIEQYDQLVPIIGSWLDLPLVDLAQTQLCRYAVRTGFEWMRAFERKYGRLPTSIVAGFQTFMQPAA